MTDIEVIFPKKLKNLFKPYRYKVLYGGRGGAKSWGIARALLIIGAQKPIRVLCAREVQKSVQESVHRLLETQINNLGFDSLYEVQKAKIIGTNGTEFIFVGLQHNINSLKSYEGVDIVWCEEAHNISKHSWDVLIPTIRKPESEIWLSFNPELEDDETYQRFVLSPPDDAWIEKIGWQDNPWFPEVLAKERDALKLKNHDDYLHIWEGQPRKALAGAIFADDIIRATEERRITLVKPESGVPVNTYWDLGRSDNTAIWFAQLIGLEYRIIDYYQANGQHMAHFIETVRERGYVYGTHYLPHDARNEQLAAEKTIEQQMLDAIRDNKEMGKHVVVVPRVSKKALAIDAARKIFDRCFFDATNTKDGLQCLRHYRYATNPQTGSVGKEPLHDMYSHGADAFLTLAQNATNNTQSISLTDFYS